MRIAVVRFPGSNCDFDGLFALRDNLGFDAEFVWHETTSLKGFDGAFLPGGFSYGDYLRCGAMASHSPVMDEVRRFAKEGRPVIGVCNGFQVLCEAGLLPGALVRNIGEKFVCRDIYLRAENSSSVWTRGIDRVLRLPVAHGEGRYIATPETLAKMSSLNQIALRYVDSSGERNTGANPNGSIEDIAGVLNEHGNVLGMMPHPERYTSDRLGGTDGKLILAAFARVASTL